MVLCTAEFAHLLPMNVQHIVDGALDVLHGGSCLEGSSFIYVIFYVYISSNHLQLDCISKLLAPA